ncbi:MAG: class I SAM-dependent methyltransferase [Planctomycetota bacterium]
MNDSHNRNSNTAAPKAASDQDRKLGKNYDRAAWFYETSAKFYSTNQIRASKRYQVQFIQPNQKVLYLGAGAGEDAIMAARQGAAVTCIDISQGMLDRVQRKFDKEQLDVELICQNAFDHDRFGYYDVVAANYFLNVFRRKGMKAMLNHTAKLLRDDGYYLIADVARSQGSWPSRLFNIVYLKMAMISFWSMGLVPLHENYDYCSFFADAKLTHEHTEFFRFAKKGPVVFQSILARKNS